METLIEPGETKRLEALSRYKILDSPPEPAFDELASLASEVCETPISLIGFLDTEREWFKSRVGVEVPEIPRAQAFCAQAIRQTDLMVVPDAAQDPRFADNPLVKGEQIRFFAAFPLLSSDGHGLGALCVLDRVPHDLTARQQQILRTLGHEAMILLNLRRENVERQQRNELQAVELKRVREQLAIEVVQHRKAEEDLVRRERQLADAQRLSKLGSWEWDFKTDTIAWSDELFRIFGVQPGKSPPSYDAYLEHIHPDDRDDHNSLVKSTLQSRGYFRSEKRVVRPDGSVRYLQSSGEVILDAQGRPDRMVGFAQDITAQKELERKLQENISLLESTIESTADGILVVKTDGKLARYNRRFAQMWQIPEAILLAKDDDAMLAVAIKRLKHPKAFITRVRELYASPEEDSFDVVELKDGRVFERYSRPQRCNGKIIGRVWSFRDVTEERRTLKTLRHSEERYRSLVLATSEVVWTADANGRFLASNTEWREFTGQSLEEITGENWAQCIHPKDRDRTCRLWAEAVQRKTFFVAEYTIQRADGQYRDFLSRGAPVFKQDGTVREWIGVGVDITERKRAEQTIIDERDFSNAIINSLPGAFYVVDEQGKLLRWNSNLEEVTGYSAEEISEMHMEQFIAPEYVDAAREAFNQALTKGDTTVELDIVAKDGSRCPYVCTGRLVFLHGLPRVIGTSVDISKRKQAEEEVKKLNQELEKRVQERTTQLNASNKDLQSFSYTISHDLKAPLRAITGFAEAIQQDCGDLIDEEHKTYLQRILQSSSRMGQLIEDLLTYSRIGRSAINLAPVTLRELLEPIVEEFRFLVQRTGGSIDLQCPMPRVEADPSLLTQAVSNLIENAVKYRRPDIPLSITVCWRSENHHVVLCVVDNGIGIAPEHHERIFEVFQRLHGNEEYQGTGIGLANVRKAIELQGGSVWVESELGKGSTFCIRLRRAQGTVTP